MSKSQQAGTAPRPPKPKTHTCLFCDKVLHSYRTLKFHTNSHAHERPYECPESGLTFTNPKNLWAHRNRVQLGLNLKNSKLTCLLCDKELHSRKTLEYHTNGHTGESPYQCKNCKMTFSDPKILWKHKKKVTKCSAGSEGTTLRSLVNEDKREVKENKPEVGKVPSDNVPKVIQQNLEEVERKQILAEPCLVSSVCYDPKVINREKERTHPTGFDKNGGKTSVREEGDLVREYFPKICLFCDKGLASNKTLELHTNAHIGEKPYPCTNCEETFTDIGMRCCHNNRVHNFKPTKSETASRKNPNFKRGYITEPYNLARPQKSAHPESEVPSATSQKNEPENQEDAVVSQNKTEQNQPPNKPEMSLEEILKWQKRMQEEWQVENRRYQENLAAFVWNMNKQ